MTADTLKDSLGKVIHITENEYDDLGRVVKEWDQDKKLTVYGYDGLGRLSSVAKRVWDGVNGTRYITTSYGYDEIGNKISQRDDLGRTTKYDYDNFGRRILREFPQGNKEFWAYDVVSATQSLTSNNRLAHRTLATTLNSTFASGPIMALSYDAMGRLVDKKVGNSGPYTARYTPWGGRSIVSDESGTTYYRYGRTTGWNEASPSVIPGLVFDTDWLIVKHRVDKFAVTDGITGAVPPPVSSSLVYAYDGKGRVTRVDTRFGFNPASNILLSPDTSVERSAAAYEYDEQGRLSKVKGVPTSGGLQEIASYGYAASGTLSTLSYPVPGFTQSYTYNSKLQLESITVKNANNIQQAKFDYNLQPTPQDPPCSLSGMRGYIREYRASAIPERTLRYSYDDLSRVVSEKIDASVSGVLTGTVSYKYDSVGNRLSRTTVEGSNPGLLVALPNLPNPAALVADSNDRLSSPYSFDPAGNATRYDLDADGLASDDQVNATDDVYDLEGRLTQSQRVINQGASQTIGLNYDFDGVRTRKRLNTGGHNFLTRYVVDDLNPTGLPQVMEEWTWDTTQPLKTSWSLSRSYVYGAKLIKQNRSPFNSSTVAYYVHDGLGSVRYLVELGNGTTWNLGQSYTYDAYGVLLASAGSTPNNYLFTGEQWDQDLKTYFLRARYYNPSDGRFLTMDTFEGNQSDPLSLHKYLYANGNPVNRTDPTGHESLIGVSVASAIGNSLHGMYDGVTSAAGSAMQASIFGAQAGKSMNEVLTDFVLDETGLSLAVDGYSAVKEYFGGDEKSQAALDYTEFNLVFDTYLLPWLMTEDDSEAFGVVDEIFGPQCLVAGTPVQTAEGLKVIESVKAGDLVWAWDVQANERQLRKVKRAFTVERGEIVYLVVDGVRILATADHPFYTIHRKWKTAGHLRVGELLFDESNADGKLVQSVVQRREVRRVYNLEIEGLHNFFITSEGVLTHNVSAGFNHYFPNAFAKAVGKDGIRYGKAALTKARWLGKRAHTKFHRELNAFLEAKGMRPGPVKPPGSDLCLLIKALCSAWMV